MANDIDTQLGDDTQMAWLHIGLATNLLKCGGLDVELHKEDRTHVTEVHRKLYWSIHLLNQQYGPRNMHLDILRDIQRPTYMGVNQCSMREMGVSPPQVPEEPGGSTHIEGIWVYMVQLSTLWREVQNYVSHCASGDPTPPWSLESGYSVIGAHLMNIETRFPTCHRWDSVRFMDHSKEALHRNRGYWSPWIYLQFTYHAIHSVLNHPFLYSWRPQQSAQLAIPNTFWKTSSELALIHTTWTVRLIDMLSEKEYQVSDPFLGHLVAISATIHLYYCRAADPSVRESAQSKVDACMTFLAGLAVRWPSCKAIVSTKSPFVLSLANNLSASKVGKAHLLRLCPEPNFEFTKFTTENHFYQYCPYVGHTSPNFSKRFIDLTWGRTFWCFLFPRSWRSWRDHQRKGNC